MDNNNGLMDIKSDILSTIGVELDKDKLNSKVNEAKHLSVDEIKLFGSDVQSEISTSIKELTDHCKTMDCGEAGKALINLTSATETRLETSGLQRKLFGAQRAYKKFVSKYKTATSNLESIVDKVEVFKNRLQQSYNELFELINISKTSFEELEYYTEAIESCLSEQEEKVSTLDPNSMVFLQEQNKLLVYRRRLETLTSTRAVLYLTIKEAMALIITNGTLLDNMQYTIDNVVPLWQAQIVTATNAELQRQALTINNNIKKAINTMLIDNAKRISANATAISRASNSPIIEEDTLKSVDNTLNELTDNLKKSFYMSVEQYNNSLNAINSIMEQEKLTDGEQNDTE